MVWYGEIKFDKAAQWEGRGYTDQQGLHREIMRVHVIIIEWHPLNYMIRYDLSSTAVTKGTFMRLFRGVER